MKMKVTFNWETGTPKYPGDYLISDKYGIVTTDTFDTFQKKWLHHYEEDVMAWCELIKIKSYPNSVFTSNYMGFGK